VRIPGFLCVSWLKDLFGSFSSVIVLFEASVGAWRFVHSVICSLMFFSGMNYY